MVVISWNGVWLHPLLPESLEMGLHAGSIWGAIGPAGADTIAAKQAMLILRQSRQWHEQDPLLGPTGFGGDGEYLGC